MSVLPQAEIGDNFDPRALGPPDFPAVKRATRPLRVKRLIDVSVAASLLMVVAPVLALIAVAVKVTSRGPVFFVHERVGLDGRLIQMIKFRTMRDGTHDEIWGSRAERDRFQLNGFKLPSNDSRITRVGRLLRATSIDELPQLINVLSGDMSLVGVRPLVPIELDQRSAYDRACYVSMRPGLTGLWQVTGRSTVGSVDREALDREYVEHWSNRHDLQILARTPAAILRFHHAA